MGLGKGAVGAETGVSVFPSVYQREKDPEYSFDVQEIGKLDRIVDITDQTVPDYDYEKLLEEHADSILGEYIRSMRKKEPGVCTAKALEYGVNALLGYDC